MIVESYATVLASRNRREEGGNDRTEPCPTTAASLRPPLFRGQILSPAKCHERGATVPRTRGRGRNGQPECLLFYTTPLVGIIYIYIYIRASIRTEEPLPPPLPQICPISPL